MEKHCCGDMERFVYCIDYIDRTENTDENKVVCYSPRFREYGIPVAYGKGESVSSYILIEHCPWCGRRLPASKREQWFEELEKQGYESPLSEEIPERYLTSAWYAGEGEAGL